MMYNYYNNNRPTYFNSPYYHQILNKNLFDKNSECDSPIDTEKKEILENVNKTKKNDKNIFNISKDGINVLGYSLQLDDIIIIVIAIFLLFENKKDYSLLLILGLMILDVSINSFKDIKFLSHLFNPS